MTGPHCCGQKLIPLLMVGPREDIATSAGKAGVEIAIAAPVAAQEPADVGQGLELVAAAKQQFGGAMDPAATITRLHLRCQNTQAALNQSRKRDSPVSAALSW
jgi:hypothetical protein